MDPTTTTVCLNLIATGIAAGTSVTAGGVRKILRRQKYDEDLEHVAVVFAEELKKAIEAEDARRETNELAGATDNWEAVVKEVTGLRTEDTDQLRDRERDQIGHLFTDEEDAAVQIAEAIATVQGFDLAKTPQLRQELIEAVGNAYTEAVAAFEQRIADTDLAYVFQEELQLDIREAVGKLEQRLERLTEDLSVLLTQAARNEGFRQLSPLYFQRVEPTPETSWRTTFTLADVHAGIPARRDGHGDQYADSELLAALREGDDRLVVGRAGAGKSTLCKQVAVAWYQETDLGPVLYRGSDGAGAAFESRDALREAIDRAEGHVLVVVEDAVRTNANAIFGVVDEYRGVSEVTFLLDARDSELDTEPDAQTLDRSSERRHLEIAGDVPRYELPAISEGDVARTIDAFEAATGRTVGRSASALHAEIQSEAAEGFGAFLLLSFHLPFGDAAVEQGENQTGLEAHVRSRYRTLMQPGSDGTLRDLSRFDPELLGDVGVMVNLLNASGIGIAPELVHALGIAHGTERETHEEIARILTALEGWFLYSASDGPAEARPPHPLWSTLYLRCLAWEHADHQADSALVEQSEIRTSRCLESLFALFDEEDTREALAGVLQQTPVLDEIEDNPQTLADEYVQSIFELIKQWQVLAPLAGTTDTARYDLPAACSDATRHWVTTTRGHAHLNRGAYQKAHTEYEQRLGKARELGDRQGEATSLGNLGLVARELGEYDTAREYYQQSLDIFRERGNRRGEATSLHNLGLVAHDLGEYDTAREYYQQSLDIERELGDRQGEANSLNNLGSVAHDLGEYDTAREYHQQSLDIKRELGDPQGEADVLEDLGATAFLDKDIDKAQSVLRESVEIATEIGIPIQTARSRGTLAAVILAEGDTGAARDRRESALSSLRDLGAIPAELEILRRHVLAERDYGDDERAVDLCQRGLDRIASVDPPLSHQRHQLKWLQEELVDDTDST